MTCCSPKGQPLPRAVGITLAKLSAPASGRDGPHAAAPGRSFPPLSVATPALFGATAASLSLAAPEHDGPADRAARRPPLARFPPPPARFVGRTAVMARSSAALAIRSGVPGVLLHGMPGGGKTACALEIGYGHEHAFDRLVWYKAPDDGMAINGALTDFALALEQELPGFTLLDVLMDEARLTGFLPRLSELMEQQRVLLVIDNAESLLAESGQWRDARWGQVVGALTAHRGLGRVILTSRRVPAGARDCGRRRLTRCRPTRRCCWRGSCPTCRPSARARLPASIAARLVSSSGGRSRSPKATPSCWRLANGQAAHPGQLAALVAAGDQAWREQGGLPDGFFAAPAVPAAAPAAAGTDGTAATDYRPVLAAWTESIADTLAPGERDLFWFLCCLEEPDRIRAVLDANWAWPMAPARTRRRAVRP